MYEPWIDYWEWSGLANAIPVFFTGGHFDLLRGAKCMNGNKWSRRHHGKEKKGGDALSLHFLYPTVLCIKIAGETPYNQAGATQHLPLPPWAILTLLEMKIQEEHKSRLAARTVYHSSKVCCLADKNAISNRFYFFFRHSNRRRQRGSKKRRWCWCRKRFWAAGKIRGKITQEMIILFEGSQKLVIFCYDKNQSQTR